MSELKVGIAGVGYVGGAVRHWFESQDCELFLYDTYKKLGSPEELNRADIIFVAVPTPFNEGRGYDDSAVREVVDMVGDGKTIVIKSTVLPGTTDALQKIHPGKTILFSPEFLRETSAADDFVNPHTQLVGYTDKEGSRKEAEKVLGILPPAPFSRVVWAREAEVVKYFRNAFLATRVIFANQMYDLCEKLGVEYDIVKECAAADPRVGGSHFDIWHDGHRGYARSCFPKDVKSLIELGEKLGVTLPLIREVDDINASLVKKKQE